MVTVTSKSYQVKSDVIEDTFAEKGKAVEDQRSATGSLLDNWLVQLANYFPGYAPVVSKITLSDGSAYNVPASEPLTVTGTYGHLVVRANGSYYYVADKSDALAADTSAKENFSFTVKSGNFYTTSTIQITITGTNDVPVVNADLGSVLEGATLSVAKASGVLKNDSDVDNGDTLKVIQVAAGNVPLSAQQSNDDDETDDDENDSNGVDNSVTGTFGHLTLKADGSYTYKADTTQADALKAGQTATDVFSYRIADGHGGYAQTTLTITVTGSNDGPVALADRNALQEDRTLTVAKADGVLKNDSDLDSDTLTVTGVSLGDGAPAATNVGKSLLGTYGHLTLKADGSYTYAADTAKADTLKAGQTATETFTYRIADGQGGTATTTLTLTITGTNDRPVATADTGAVNENGKLTQGTADGLLSNDTDIDGDKLTVTGVAVGTGSPATSNMNKSISGTYGHLTVHNNGNYEYSADTSAANKLKAGQIATETFTYRIADGQGSTTTSTLTISITGQNDAPVASHDTGTLLEAATLSVSAANGVLKNDTDVDVGDTLTVIGVARPEGSLSAANVAKSIAGTYGHLTLNADGSYTYKADTAAATQLSAGQTATDTFTYRVADGSGSRATNTLTLTITGVGPDAGTAVITPPNAAPVAVADVGQVAENGTVSALASGGVLKNDTDANGDVLTVTGVAPGATAPAALNLGHPIAGTYGHLTLAADGSYTYAADVAAANALKAGVVRTDVFTYQVSDGKGGLATTTLTLSVTGTNDVPLLTADTGTVNENLSFSRNIAAGVLANDSDIDGDVLTVAGLGAGLSTPVAGSLATPVAGTYGHLSMAGNGSYTYTADTPAANALKAGEIKTDTFTYLVSDGNGGSATATLTMTITGTNDLPVAAANTGAVNENATLNITAASGVLANDSDVDGDPLVVSAASPLGTAPGTSAVGQAILGTYGHLTLRSDGSYTYAADTAAANALKVGEIKTDSFAYTVNDGQGGTAVSTLAITVTGTNDGPSALNDGNITVREGGSFTADAVNGVLINDTDPDGDPLVVTGIGLVGSAPSAANLGTAITGTYGHLTLNANGSYTFSADTPAALTLAAGQVRSEAFTYQISDGHGGTASATLSVTISGSNAGPVAHVDTGAVNEDATLVVNAQSGVLANDLDPDGDLMSIVGVGQTQPQAANVGVAITGTYGHLTLAADGSYRYAADTAAANALKAGATQIDTFTYQVTDTQGSTATATLTITITGTNDQPVVGADIAAVNEDAIIDRLAANGLLTNDTDVDGDTLTIAAASALGTTPSAANVGTAILGTYGHLTLNTDGSYHYAADTPAANALKVGEIKTDVFTYLVSDGNGGSAATSLTITITGTNDAPIASGDTGGVFENASLDTTSANGVLSNDTDVDHDLLAVTAVSKLGLPPDALAVGHPILGTYGHLSLNPNGSYHYSADAQLTHTLKLGEVQTDTFTYVVSDGHGGSSMATLAISITGTNDQPLLVADVAAVDEDATLIQSAANGVLSNDSDIDGDAIAVSGVSAGNGLPNAQNIGQAILGTYGHLTMSSDGSYQYTADTAAANALKLGEIKTDTFTYLVADSQGGSAITSLTITITGTNDAPVASADIIDLGNTTSLNIGAAAGVLANDRDTDHDNLTVTGIGVFGAALDSTAIGVPVQGTYGHLILNADGSYSYNLDTLPGQSLSIGQNATDLFVYQVTDPNGAQVTSTLSINVSGTNLSAFTAPIHGLYNTGVNDANQALSNGQLDPHYALVDAPMGSTTTNMVTSDPQWVANDADSAWIGTPNLADYSQQTDLSAYYSGNFSYQTQFTLPPDANPSTVRINFDLAVDDQVVDVLLNGVSTGMQINGSTQGFSQVAMSGLDMPFQSGTNTLTFVVFNGTGWNVSPSLGGPTGIRIDNLQATLDYGAPLDGNVTGTVQEALHTDTLGQISVPGNNGVLFTAQDHQQGLYGWFSLNANGTWTYSLDNTAPQVQGLGLGQAVFDNFTVASVDGATATVTIRVDGFGHAPDGTDRTIVYGGNHGNYQLTQGDIGFNAGLDGGEFVALRFTATNHINVYLDDGTGPVAIAMGDTVSAADISAGHIFINGLSPNAVSTGQLGFLVQDSNGNWDQIPNTLSLTCINDQSPLVLDLNGDGVQSISLAAGVSFDITADGILDRTGWASSQDGLLALDLNGDSQINSGAELFGNHTQLADGSTAANGFAALAQYDDNHDGVINQKDAIYNDLLVWQDKNQDGLTETGELSHLNTAGIAELGLDFTQSSSVVAGNLHAQQGSYTATDGTAHAMTDVWFNTQQGVATPATASSIPTLDMRDLLAPDAGSLDHYLAPAKPATDTPLRPTTPCPGLETPEHHAQPTCDQQIIQELLQKNQMPVD